MNPFYFGPGDRPLFGVFTHGRESGDVEGAVLLCYPVGSEYMRAHRAFRQLNSLLNRAGFDVLRFDYSHTGDSAGSGVDASVTDWLDDVEWAIDELQANAMTEMISVCGLRMGGALATAACTDRDDIAHLLLWDPIVSGKSYLDECLGVPRPDDVVGLEGFPISPRLQTELDDLELRQPMEGLAGKRLTIVACSDEVPYREMVEAQRRAGAEATLTIVPSQGDWAVADPFGDALIPQQIIRSIVDRLRSRQTT